MAAIEATSPDQQFTSHLEHFAGARTNPYAIQVARQICKDFKLSVNGQRRLNKALNDLPCLDTADPRLSFGWSYEHIIRTPRVHQFAYEHLTIVITLAECFHETYAAEVFNEMAKARLPPTQITPHIYQWLDLLHYCNGILANDDFGLLVESFINLDPYSVTPGSKYSADRCLVPTKPFANALLALSDLTCGNRTQLTLRGGSIIGFLAALAEHFYDLRLTIESAEGTHLYGPHDGGSLVLVYTDKPEIHIEGDTLSNLTHRISNLSIPAYSAQIHFLPFGGRLTWQNVLPQVFGSDFQALEHQHSRLMYIAIGSAFRALEGAPTTKHTVNGRETPQLANLPPEIDTTQRIASLTGHFPTLQKGSSKMERQLRQSPEAAAQVHAEHMRELASLCSCAVCGRAVNEPTSDGRSQVVGYCLPSIVETIICLGLMLSRVVLVLPIFPSREGIQLLYKLRTDRYQRIDRSAGTVPPALIADLYDRIPTAPTAFILRMAVKVFGGGHLAKLGTDMLPNSLVAISHDGVCAFAAELASGRGVRQDMKGMIRLVPGSFGIKLKTYHMAAWDMQRPGGRDSWQWEEIELEHLKAETDGRLWFK